METVDELMDRHELIQRAKQALIEALEGDVYGKGVVADPNIVHGMVTVKGTRIQVSNVLAAIRDELHFDGELRKEMAKRVKSEYPGINEQAIEDVLTFAAEVLHF